MPNCIRSLRAPFFLLFLTILFTSTAWSQESPWFFAVLSDPQMGMYANNQNFAQETANFEFAIANLNRLHPRFVVICGDLVNRSGDSAEIAEYKRILAELDPAIPVYNVAGNHDVGNVPTTATVDAYRSTFGDDYYTFMAPGILGIVLDSNLIRSPESNPKAAQEQEAWLEKTLASAKSDSTREPIVFQHIPYFIHDPSEAVTYFNIPQPARQTYLDLLEKAGVRYVFAGHLHYPVSSVDGALTEIITGAVGKPLGQSASGLRIVRVDGQKLDSRWYCLGRVPNVINAAQPLPETDGPGAQHSKSGSPEESK
jgi:serine/threonine-protein phosphatase CPPED1